MKNLLRTRHRLAGKISGHALPILLAGTVLSVAGCTAFSPAFLDVVGAPPTIGNAPGHVVIAFINNATVDERIVDFLESPDGGSLVLTPAQKRSLRPVMRLRVGALFSDNSYQILEFFSGSRELVPPAVDDVVAQDLDQPDFTNGVVICDVTNVTVLQDLGIEVFVPVEIQQYTFTQTALTGVGIYRLSGILPASFHFLQEDFVTMQGQVIRANIGSRDVPAPVESPLCGSVVTITVTGELAVPFFDPAVAGGFPSYDVEDLNAASGIGGRYGFQVSVR